MDRAHTRKSPVIFVCIPVYNEADNLAQLVDEIMFINGGHISVAVVDNGSTDGTAKIIRALDRKYSGRFFYTWEPYGCGITHVYRKAFNFACVYGADIVIGMDAGGSHSPADLEKFVTAITDYDCDCVFGSRILGDYSAPVKRKLVSRCGNILSRFLLGLNLTDATSGFSAFKSDILKNIKLNTFKSRWYFYDTELKYHCRNYTYMEVPISYKTSRSSFRYSHISEAVRVLLYYALQRLDERIHDRSSGAVTFMFP